MLLFVALILCLILLEIGFRLFWTQYYFGFHQFENGTFQLDDDIGYKLTPGFHGNYTTPSYRHISFSTNSMGLRDVEHTYKKTTPLEYWH